MSAVGPFSEVSNCRGEVRYAPVNGYLHITRVRRKGQEQTSRPCSGMPALLPRSAREMAEAFSVWCLERASLRLSQMPAQDSAGRRLPKQGRQAWEGKEELREELQERQEEPEEVPFSRPGQPACEDLDVGCRKSSTVGCWTSSAASPDSAESSPARSTRRVDGLLFSDPPAGLRCPV